MRQLTISNTAPPSCRVSRGPSHGLARDSPRELSGTEESLREIASVSGTDPHVSVVIPCYNGRATLPDTLGALRKQHPPFAFEVIVVDSSDDGTDVLVAQEFPEVRLVHRDEKTPPGAARNLGVELAKASLLAFTDADCVPPADWLERLVEAHAADPCAALGGAVRNGRRGNPVSVAECLIEFSEYLPSAPAGHAGFLPTCNALFTREAFERYGPFHPDLYASEDRLLGWRMEQAGERIRFEPSIAIDHLFRTHFRTFLKHQRALGAGAAIVREHYPLPDRWLVTSPLRWAIGLARLLRLQRRLLGQSFADFLRFNVLSPITFSGVLSWGWGFATGRRSGERQRLRLDVEDDA